MLVRTFLRSRVLQRYVSGLIRILPFLIFFFDKGIMGNTDVSIAVDIWPSCTRSASLRFGKFPDSLISLVFWPFPGDC